MEDEKDLFRGDEVDTLNRDDLIAARDMDNSRYIQRNRPTSPITSISNRPS